MFLGELIKNFRTKNSLSMQEFADKAGFSKAYVSMLERNQNSTSGKEIVPSITTLKAVGNVMGLEIDELLRVLDKKQKISIKSTKQAVRINVYGSIPAGVPIEAIEDIDDWEEIPAEMVEGGKEYIALKVKGDSMYPKYLEGDVL